MPRRHPSFDLRSGKNSLWVIRQHEAPLATRGEYLFFAVDPELLLAIGLSEVARNRFPAAQILPWRAGDTKSRVMRLYSNDASRGDELGAKYHNAEALVYKGWKSHKESLSGKYSQRYLNSLPAGRQIKVIRPRKRRTLRDREGKIIMIQRKDGGTIL